MKTIFRLLLMSVSLLFSQAISSQSDSAIYGVVRSDQTGDLFLSKINTANGNVTVISHTGFPSPYQMNSIATIDTKNNHYYLFTNNQLVGVDVMTGSVTTTNSLSITNPYYVDMMQYNRFDSTFYAMRYTNGFLYLVKLTTASGLVTDITTNPLGVSYYMNSLAVIDPYSKIYYIQASNPRRLYGFDLGSGNVVSDTVMSTSVYDFQLMRFNPRDSAIYGIATPTASANKYLAKLNPSTGAVTVFSASPFTTPLSFNSIATLDPNKGIYYLQINNQLLGYDLHSGNLIINTPLTFPFSGRFDLMVYCVDCKNETPFGQVPTVSVQPLPESCIHEQVTLAGASSATPSATYSWTVNPSNAVSFMPNNTSSTVQAIFSGTGIYTITCTATNYLGSGADTKYVSISECTYLKENSASSDNIFLTPNPSSGMITITAPNGQLLSHITVYDTFGRNIIHIPSPGYSHKTSVLLDLSTVSPGMYFINFLSDNKVITKKIIIDKPQ